jgi:cytochrome c oxidase cbb3-type subunit 3
MMTERASLFVIVFTVINIAACLWLMWWTARTRASKIDPTASEESTDKTGHVWDGDLEEYNNPLPRWWLGLFIITIAFAAAYLTFYPGLGNFSGAKRWTQVGQYEAQVAEARAQLDQRLAAVKDRPLAELARDANAMSTARNLFGANCSTCHGSDARGARSFPNLTDSDWLWGGGADLIYQTIAHGRTGTMPALGEVLGADGVNEVAAYVVSLSGQKAPADWVSAGEQRFATLCAGCHGVEAKGNQLLGAPNLTDDAWLHGGDFDTVRATITKGRNNQMPAHLDTLGEAKVRLLAAYVLSLGHTAGPSQQANRPTGQQAREESEEVLPEPSSPVDQLASASAAAAKAAQP